jgi:hypothetical protein
MSLNKMLLLSTISLNIIYLLSDTTIYFIFIYQLQIYLLCWNTIRNIEFLRYQLNHARELYLFVFTEGWRESMLGTSRRLLSSIGSFSRDSSSCPFIVSKWHEKHERNRANNYSFLYICIRLWLNSPHVQFNYEITSSFYLHWLIFINFSKFTYMAVYELILFFSLSFIIIIY